MSKRGDIINVFLAKNTIQYRGAAMAAETARAEPFNLIRVIPA
jgi:hypothetical protein